MAARLFSRALRVCTAQCAAALFRPHAAILTIACPSLGNIPGSKECSRAACLLGRGIADDNGLASYGKRPIDHAYRVITFTLAQAIQMEV
jgi:hypothetical protein